MSQVYLSVAFALFFSFAVKAELPENLMAPCEVREANLEQLNSQLKDPAASGCVQQIKTGRDICFAETEGALTDFSSGGAVSTAQQSFDAHQAAVRSYSTHALKCEDEVAVIHRRCREMADGLAQARRDNQATTDEYIAKRSSAARGSAYEQELHQQVLAGFEIDKELLSARMATMNAMETAMRILRRQKQCYANKAIIYADARDQAGVVMASASGQNMEGSVPAPGEAMVTNEATPVSAAMVNESREAEAPTVMNAGVGAGAVVDTVSAYVTPSTVSVAGAQTAADYTAQKFLTPKNAIRFSGVGTFLLTVFEPTQISMCSDLYLDPTQAYLANCPVFVPHSVSANENAIRTLSGK